MGDVVALRRTVMGVTRPKSVAHSTMLLVLVPVLGILLSACLGSNYDYLSHVTSGGGDMYFRVPSNWTVFSEKQIIDSLPKPPSAASIPAIEAVNFEQIFAAPGAPSKVTSIGFQNATPVGTVTAGLLSASQRDSFSLASLRALVLGVDPMNTLSGAGSGASGTSTSGDTVVNYQEFVRPGGYRGSTMTVQVKSGAHPFEFTQSAVVDQGTNWVYFIAVGCADACFKANAASIAQVVSSWNVKAVTK